MIKDLFGLFEKLGVTTTGILMMIAGVVLFLPYFDIPVYMCQGAGLFAAGGAIVAFGIKSNKAQRQFVESEAEKRIDSTVLPAKSDVPAIQNEIEKKLVNRTNGAV